MNRKYCILLLLISFLLVYVEGIIHSNNNIPSIRTLAATTTTNIAAYNNNEKIINPIEIITRFPRSLYIGTYIGIESFIQTALIMLPIGLMLKFGCLKEGFKPWIQKGSQLGIEWGTLSAMFSGGESFFANIRQKRDRWNSYMGSGLTSACMRIKEGPKSIIMNFCIGFAFMYVVDMIAPSTVPSSIEQTVSHEATTKLPKISDISKKLTPTLTRRAQYNSKVIRRPNIMMNNSNIAKFLKNIIR